jgi:hypothetical protein
MFANISFNNALKYFANKDATLHIMLNNIVLNLNGK